MSRAVLLLSSEISIVSVSSVYEAEPADAPNAPTFLNAAVAVATHLEPIDLKIEILRPIEARLKRYRTADRSAPRTIDLDLTLYRDRVIDDVNSDLVLPDPEILERAHVALPLADLAPDALHPVTHQTLREIAKPFQCAAGIRVYAELDLTCVIRGQAGRLP